MRIADKKRKQMKVRVIAEDNMIFSNMMMMTISGGFGYGGFSCSYILRSYFGCVPSYLSSLSLSKPLSPSSSSEACLKIAAECSVMPFQIFRKKSENLLEEIWNFSGRNPKIVGKKSYSSPDARRGRLLENRCGVQCYELLIGQNCKFQHKSKRGRRSQRPFVI